MSGQLNAASTRERGALDNIDPWSIVTLHIAVAGSKVFGTSGIEIARNGQGLEEHFGHDNSAAKVEHHAAVVQIRQCSRQALEIAVTRGAECGTVARRVLMDDFCADRSVHGDGDRERGTREQHGDVAPGEILPGAQVVGERLARSLLALGAAYERGVHLPSRLLRHAEGTVA